MDAISYKTVSKRKEDVQPTWYVVDATNKVVGRLATEIARIIRGKHRPDFTPNINGGDKVVVINADKVRFTGNKMSQKLYIRHSNYPGGQRSETPERLMRRFPERILMRAVHNMLPKNRLQQPFMRNLFVYAGTEHPHEAQQPQELKL